MTGASTADLAVLLIDARKGLLTQTRHHSYIVALHDIRDIVVERQTLSPWDLEQRFGIAGGNIFHGEMSIDQMFVMRPLAGSARYRRG